MKGRKIITPSACDDLSGDVALPAIATRILDGETVRHVIDDSGRATRRSVPDVGDEQNKVRLELASDEIADVGLDERDLIKRFRDVGNVRCLVVVRRQITTALQPGFIRDGRRCGERHVDRQVDVGIAGARLERVAARAFDGLPVDGTVPSVTRDANWRETFRKDVGNGYGSLRRPGSIIRHEQGVGQPFGTLNEGAGVGLRQ